MDEKNYNILLEKYQEIQNQRKALSRKFKKQEDLYQIKIKELELDRKILNNKLKEKESVNSNNYLILKKK